MKGNFGSIIATFLAIAFLSAYLINLAYIPFRIATNSQSDNPFEPVELIFFGLSLIVEVFFFIKYLAALEKETFEIETQPVIYTDGAICGLPFAGKGIIVSDNGKTLNSLYTNSPCVYFHSITTKYYSGGLKNKETELFENASQFVPFSLRDDRGNLKIDIKGMDMDFSGKKIFSNNNPLKPDGFLKMFFTDISANFRRSRKKKEQQKKYKNLSDGSVIDCDHVLADHKSKDSGIICDIIYTQNEYIMAPGTEVFVYGFVSKNEAGELVLQESHGHPLIIGTGDRKDYFRAMYGYRIFYYLSPFIISIGYWMILSSAGKILNSAADLFYPLFTMGNLLIAAIFIAGLYNRMVTFKNRALNALSNIGSELKRRADLIPNMANMVKGYSGHEEKVQQMIVDSRDGPFFSKELALKNGGGISFLSALAEENPELKASEEFNSLMSELFETEDRIAYSRSLYNESVERYNILIKSFPFLVVAACFRMKKMDFLVLAPEQVNSLSRR